MLTTLPAIEQNLGILHLL